MDPPGEEDENHPPLPSSWQLAKAGPAGGLHCWDLEVVCVFSCICLSLFPWNGMGETAWRHSPFLWFSFPHVSTADADFSCLNFSYKLGVGLVVFPLEFEAWAGLFLPIQLCLLSFFGAVQMWWSPGGSSERSDFSAGGFLLGKLVEILDLEAAQGCGVPGFACQRGLLPLEPC